MAENRRRYAENYNELQRSLFLFKTGLSNVNGKIKSTAESYAALIQSEKLEQTQEIAVDQFHRRAS
jgi:hypothetical protein